MSQTTTQPTWQTAEFKARLEKMSLDQLMELRVIIAAVRMGMSYRKAQNLLKRIRAAREAGGSHEPDPA